MFNLSVRSTNVLNFIEMQNTWCNFSKKFAHLAWKDPLQTFTKSLKIPSLFKNVQCFSNFPWFVAPFQIHSILMTRAP